jgi:hypothetical protein
VASKLQQPAWTSGPSFCADDPELGYRIAPREHIYRRAKTLPGGSQIYDVSYSIDAEGVSTTPAGKGSGAAPVFFFGDSFTFGEGVSNGQTLAAAFARVTEHGTVNFGVPGYGPHHMLRMLELGRERSLTP